MVDKCQGKGLLSKTGLSAPGKAMESSPGQGVGARRNEEPHAAGEHTQAGIAEDTQGRQQETFLRVPGDLQKPSPRTQRRQKGSQVWCPSRESPSGSLGARTAKLLLQSLPGGQRPTEHLTAVLHYVAMAVGILHAVLPSPGPLDLQQAEPRSAPPALPPAHRALRGTVARRMQPRRTQEAAGSRDSSEEQEDSTYVLVGRLVQCHQEGVEPS